MVNQIDLNYFRGLIHLPYANLSAGLKGGSATSVDKGQDELTDYITRYQKKLLVEMFGSEVIPEEVADLVNDTDTKESPIAYYTFCRVIHMYQTRNTLSGDKVKKSNDSDNSQYQEKYLAAWNEMVRINREIRLVLYDAGKHEIYPTDDNSELYRFKYWL